MIRLRTIGGVGIALLVLGVGLTAPARVVLPLDQFLALLAPGATAEADTKYLSDAQKKAVEEAAGSALPGKVIHRRKVTAGDTFVGWVYFDRHRVRTLPETVAVAIGPDGKVLRTEVLAFSEPQNYKPRAAWLRLFDQKGAKALPRYKHDIDGMTGATLTGRAVTDAVRRALVLHATLDQDT